MSRYSERSAAPAARIVGGNPEVRSDVIRKAKRQLERVARDRVKAGPLVVLSALLEFLNPVTLECWPSVETLSRRIPRMAVRSVKRHLQALRAAGLLSWQGRSALSGRISNAYCFNFGLVGLSDLYGVPAVPAAKRRRPAPVEPEPGPAVVVASRPVQGVACGALDGVPAGAGASDREAAARFQGDLRSVPAVAARWWAVADAEAEGRAIRAERARRGAGLLAVAEWIAARPHPGFTIS